MKKELISYFIDGVEMEGFIAYDPSSSTPRPAVLVAHAWRGCDEFAKEKAVELARLGYVGFAADVYGKGKRAPNGEKALQLMLPLFADRSLLQKRIQGAFQLLEKYPFVQPDKRAAVGFCFGGLTVLELLRSGAPVKGIVSFHGILANSLGDVQAKRTENNTSYKGAALFLHGNDDPMVSSEDIRMLYKELDEHTVDWQFHTYGRTLHAFTNPEAHSEEDGTVYSPAAARRSWQTMKNFLEELFI